VQAVGTNLDKPTVMEYVLALLCMYYLGTSSHFEKKLAEMTFRAREGGRPFSQAPAFSRPERLVAAMLLYLNYLRTSSHFEKKLNLPFSRLREKGLGDEGYKLCGLVAAMLL
jgi:hypothetical protein